MERGKRKFKNLFCSTFSHKLSLLSPDYLDSKLSKVVWAFFEELERLELEQFLEVVRCFEEALLSSKERLKVKDENIYRKRTEKKNEQEQS